MHISDLCGVLLLYCCPLLQWKCTNDGGEGKTYQPWITLSFNTLICSFVYIPWLTAWSMGQFCNEDIFLIKSVIDRDGATCRNNNNFESPVIAEIFGVLRGIYLKNMHEHGWRSASRNEWECRQFLVGLGGTAYFNLRHFTTSHWKCTYNINCGNLSARLTGHIFETQEAVTVNFYVTQTGRGTGRYLGSVSSQPHRT